MQRDKLRVALQQLRGEALEGEVVDVWIRIEKVEIDVDEALLGRMSGR